MQDKSLKRCCMADLASPRLIYNILSFTLSENTHLPTQHALQSWCYVSTTAWALTHIRVFFLTPGLHTHLCLQPHVKIIQLRLENDDRNWRWSLYLQRFTFPIQPAAQALVVGRQHVQFRPQGIVGCGRSLGDETIHAVGKEFDLELFGVDLFLGPLIEKQTEREVNKAPDPSRVPEMITMPCFQLESLK